MKRGKGNVYVLIAVVMIGSFIFLTAALASPYKSILLPVNIPVEFNFESVQLMDPRIDSNGASAYEIVILQHDGTLLRLTPEEARNNLQITAGGLSGSAKLTWGDSNNLNFYGKRDETVTPCKVVLTGPLAPNGNTPSVSQAVCRESGFEGVMGIDANARDSVMMHDFNWALGGASIPMADGKAETGTWFLTSKQGSPVQMMIGADDRVTIDYVSLFTSPNLYAQDLNTGQTLPIAFETTLTGSITPMPSELPSYVNSQIYLQGFGWLMPVAALMAIIYVDDRYRRKIRKMINREVLTE